MTSTTSNPAPAVRSRTPDADAARGVIRAEADALAALLERLDDQAFARAVDVLFAAAPYVVVTGVGKSGHIGSKIASSLASTGAPSFFLHPAEASHGDLGMIAPGCALIAISNSGESRELRDVLLYARNHDNPIVAITRAPDSTLGRLASVALLLPDVPEACPNGLAPTTSTIATLALGDALTVALMQRRGFTRDEFGRRHPGGKLGLGLKTVADFLVAETEPSPLVSSDARADEVLMCVTEGRKGCAGVVDANGKLVGMITDGDLRRAISPDFFAKTAAEIMSPQPTVLSTDMKMSDVIDLFTERRISNAFVVEGGVPIGVVHMKDLMSAGYL